MQVILVKGGVEQVKEAFETLSSAGKQIYICVEVIAGHWLIQAAQ